MRNKSLPLILVLALAALLSACVVGYDPGQYHHYNGPYYDRPYDYHPIPD
jgi:hypothetical protein